MPLYRATDQDGQCIHALSAAMLGERTLRLGDQTTLWDVHEVDRDRQAGPRYVGYMADGQLVQPETQREAG
jgi:hypothetical protein